jgi:hypothetical protein
MPFFFTAGHYWVAWLAIRGALRARPRCKCPRSGWALARARRGYPAPRPARPACSRRPPATGAVRAQRRPRGSSSELRDRRADVCVPLRAVPLTGRPPRTATRPVPPGGWPSQPGLPAARPAHRRTSPVSPGSPVAGPRGFQPAVLVPRADPGRACRQHTVDLTRYRLRRGGLERRRHLGPACACAATWCRARRRRRTGTTPVRRTVESLHADPARYQRAAPPWSRPLTRPTRSRLIALPALKRSASCNPRPRLPPARLIAARTGPACCRRSCVGRLNGAVPGDERALVTLGVPMM